VTPAIRPQPPEASDSPPAPSAAHPGAQIAAGVIGSVAVTVAAKELGGSPWGTLVVALIGATVPVLISYTPRHRHLRLGIAAILVAVAFALTYGGFALYDAAADKQTFPRPGPTPTPTASQTPDGDGGDGGSGPSAEVGPPELRCTPEECGQVRITSTGDEAVRVDDIGFADGQANGFAPDDGCVGDSIDPGDECTFDVDYNPESGAGTQTATLIVATSDGDTSPVELEGSSTPTVDFSFATDPTCALKEGEPSVRTIGFALAGPQDGSVLVGTDVSGPPLPQNVGDVSFDLDFGEATPPSQIKITIDPDDDVIETNDGPEDNERMAPCP
jgi:hypothetical protein